MSYSEDYNMKIEVLKTITDDQIKVPNSIPLGIYIQEAASWDSKDYLEAKKIRDQAFTHLKEAVDLIREYGRYVFWRNDARLKGYRSNHLRKMRLRNTRQNTVNGSEPELNR
jgi:hypothetical protein